MDIDVDHGPSFALGIIGLDQQETILVEGDGMVSMDGNIDISTERMPVQSGGGVMSAVSQMMGGESFLVNHLTAEDGPGEVTIAPTLPGDITIHELEADHDLIIQSSSYLGSEHSISLDGEWGGAKTFFGGEGFFMLRAAGEGNVLINSFGGITKKELNGEFIIDSGHIVAFEDTLNFSVDKFTEGWVSSWLSGEGLVTTFEGEGTVYLQTRAPNGYGETIGNMLPEREN